MIASDDASVASNDKIDRQDEWRRKMKEEAKRSAQNQLRDWVVKITLDDIVLLAGRALEEVFFGSAMTGASDDLRRVLTGLV